MKSLQLFTTSILIIFSAILLSFNACNTSVKSTSFVSPPLNAVDVGDFSYTVNTEEAQVITVGSGTTIEIPANAFVDKDGAPVQGEVDLQYRELITAAEVLASGIPMKYDSAGANHYFQTAGMFELRGTHNDEEIYIAAGRSLKVNMASKVKDGTYNFYALNEETGSWSYLGTESETAIQPEPVEVMEPEEVRGDTGYDVGALAEAAKPVMLKRVNSDKPVLNFDLDYSDFPELKAFRSVVWQYAGGSGFPDPDNNGWIYDKTWNDIELLAHDANNMLYRLELSKGSEKFTTVIQPVLSEKQYEQAQQEFVKRVKQYDRAVLAKQQEGERQEMESAMVRSFEVSGFGIYNWDRIYKMPVAVRLMAKFKVKDDPEMDMSRMSIYLIAGDDRAVMRYFPSDLNNFSFNPDDVNKIVAVLPGNKVAYFSPESFDQLNLSLFQSSGRPVPYTFQLEVLPKKIESIGQLSDMIASI